MESLKEIVEIVKQLEQTSSTNGKEFILKKNKDNELLKKVTGEEFNPDYYIRYLTEKYTELYQL